MQELMYEDSIENLKRVLRTLSRRLRLQELQECDAKATIAKLTSELMPVYSVAFEAVQKFLLELHKYATLYNPITTWMRLTIVLLPDYIINETPRIEVRDINEVSVVDNFDHVSLYLCGATYLYRLELWKRYARPSLDMLSKMRSVLINVDELLKLLPSREPSGAMQTISLRSTLEALRHEESED